MKSIKSCKKKINAADATLVVQAF
ncbi:uncharacterized protein METZ01_LOCUS312347 [marine metagenome]|uniref:Uncharacterized protein n=1 Tax=marine metagenome TaxID=408172 RepID=A0A382NE67_9ZZZZ